MAPVNYRHSDGFWNLRDDAYDHPEHWTGVTPEEIFQRIGQCVEAVEDQNREVDWTLDVSEPLIAGRRAAAKR